MKKLTLKPLIIAAIVIGLTILVPNVSSLYSMTVINSALIYFIAALGLSLLMGMGGQMSFAPITFMGLGAFITSQLSKQLGWNTIIAIIAAVVIATLVSILFALVLFRLRGAYFAFATIGLVQIFSCIYTNYKPLSGGPDGINGIPKLVIGNFTFDSLYKWFYLLVAVCIICALIVERIRRISLGRSLASIRDNEIAAQTLGVNIYKTKIIAMTISSAFAALAGALLAHQNGAVSYSLFTFTTATTFIIMIMLGGVNSTIGTLVGTVLITLLPEWLRPLKEYMKIIYGVGIVLLMIFMPMGLAGLAESLWKKVKRKLMKVNVKTEGGAVDGSDS